MFSLGNVSNFKILDWWIEDSKLRFYQTNGLSYVIFKSRFYQCNWHEILKFPLMICKIILDEINKVALSFNSFIIRN